MELPFSLEDLLIVENALGQGDAEGSLPALQELRDAAEDYIGAACVTTDEIQYFSFEDAFERLAYRRVENDPRELRPAPLPFDRLYSDLAFAYLSLQEYALARDALKQAVRWNPMNCAYRLDLADIFHALGDVREWASLSHSVLDRASYARDLGRAYANIGWFFLDEQNAAAAAACERLAHTYAPEDRRSAALAERLGAEFPEVADIAEDEATQELERQGVPASPSAEIAICLIMCATDAAAAGDATTATHLTIRARDLVGQEAAKALIALVRASDAELAAEAAASSDSDAPAAEEGSADA